MEHLASSAWKIIPRFQAVSISKTVEFYTKTLGFQLGGVHPDDGSEPSFCSMFIGKKSEANIYFTKATPELFHPGAVWIALGTDELDAYYKALQEIDGIDFHAVIEDTPWGYRQFAIKDIDKNILTFFKFLEGGNPGTEESDNKQEGET